MLRAAQGPFITRKETADMSGSISCLHPQNSQYFRIQWIWRKLPICTPCCCSAILFYFLTNVLKIPRYRPSAGVSRVIDECLIIPHSIPGWNEPSMTTQTTCIRRWTNRASLVHCCHETRVVKTGPSAAAVFTGAAEIMKYYFFLRPIVAIRSWSCKH